MLNLLNCLGTGRFHFNFDLVPAMRQDAFWIATTLALSALVVIGYCVIAIN
jgi:hypothetical protein